MQYNSIVWYGMRPDASVNMSHAGDTVKQLCWQDVQLIHWPALMLFGVSHTSGESVSSGHHASPNNVVDENHIPMLQL